MKLVAALLFLAMVAADSARADEHFGDLWMTGFLKLQAGQREEADGRPESAHKRYKAALEHYRSMRYYRAAHNLALRLEDRVQLIAQKINSMGGEPYQTQNQIISGKSLISSPEGLATGEERKIPSNWQRREDRSIVVPLIETPETTKHHREKVDSLQRLELYRLLLLSGR